MPGPLAKDPALRRRNRVDARPSVLLPAEGRQGKAPAWPLPGRMQAGELGAWRQLWRTPQAVAWERMHLVRVVARYCRVLVRAEEPGAKGVLLAETRQLEFALGLCPMSFARLRWELVDAEPETPPTQSSSRDRLRIVDTTGAS